MNRDLWLSSALAGVGATLAILVLSGLHQVNGDWVLLMAPFGASAVILFGLPQSPLAQPKNVIFGHLITASIGLVFLHLFGVNGISLAIATGLGVSLMLLTKTTHPPAGANPLLIMLTGQGWWFLLDPVLFGAVLLVLVSKGFQIMRNRMRWV